MATNGNGNGSSNGSGPNWRGIEHAYVTDPTEPSYAQLAQRFHVPADTIEKRGQRGHWSQKRSDFRRGVSERAQKRIADAQVEDLVAINAEFAREFRETALLHLKKARDARKPSQARSWMLSAAVGYDKMRLATGQTTASTEQKHSGSVDVRFPHLSMGVLAEIVNGSDPGTADAGGGAGGG